MSIFRTLWPPTVFAALCWLAAGVNYLLFHTLAELLSIVVAVTALVVATTSRQFARQHFVVYVSVAIGWCAGLDLLHTLAFKGMSVLPTDSANPATQFWIAARAMQAVALITAPLMLHRTVNIAWPHLMFGAWAVLATASIASGDFPTAYVDGVGLTPFKVYAEYFIIALLGGALVVFWLKQRSMAPALFYSMAAAALAMMLSEFAFTQYVGVYAPANLIGHLLKIYAYWFVYVALVQTTLREPFVQLKTEVDERRRLAHERERLLWDLGERIKELRCLKAVSDLTGQPNLSLPTLLQEAVGLLRPGFVWPEQVRVAVVSEWGHYGDPLPGTAAQRALVEAVELQGRVVVRLHAWYPDELADPRAQLLPEESTLLQNVARYMGTAIARLQAGERVQRLQYLYEMLSATNRAVANSQQQDELLEGLFRALLAHGTFPMLFVALTDDGQWPLRLWRSHGVPDARLPLLQAVLTDSASPLAAAFGLFSAGEVIWSGVLRTQALGAEAGPLDSWLDFLLQQGITQRAVMPIMCQGRLRGVVGLYSSGLTVFDDEQLQLLREMAGDLGVAMDKLASQTQYQQSERQARLMEHRFQEVFRVSPVPMQIEALDERRVRSINDAHRRWLGYDLSEITEEDNWFKLAFRDTDKRNELRAHWQESVNQSLVDGQTRYSPELTLYCKDGSTRTARGTFAIVGNDAIVAWTDLTDIRRSEQALRESELRFRSMVEQTISGMYVRRDGRFIYVNPRFCEIIGWEAKDLVGQSVLAFTSSDQENVRKIHQAWAELHDAQHDSVTYSVPLIRKDGQLIEVGLTAKLITWDDGLPATIVMAQDITQRKRAEDQIAAYVKQLEGSMRGTLQAVSNMVEMRDPYTAGHERRVGLIASAIAREMGWNTERCDNLELMGLVHDIGKIAVPSEILTKPTRLSKLEMELMKGHAQAGYDILKDVPFAAPVAEIIRQHHERMDGSGYPRGLRGEDILPEARVLAVADVIESMASHRPYRPAVGLDAALAEVVNNRGRLYAPEVVDAAVRLVRDKGYALPV